MNDGRPYTIKTVDLYASIVVNTKEKQHIMTLADFLKKVKDYTGWKDEEVARTVFLTPNREFDERIVKKIFPGMTNWRSHPGEEKKVEFIFPSYLGREAKDLYQCKGTIIDETVEVDKNNCGRTIYKIKWDEDCRNHKKDDVEDIHNFDVLFDDKWKSEHDTDLLIAQVYPDETGRCQSDKEHLTCKVKKVDKYFYEDD